MGQHRVRDGRGDGNQQAAAGLWIAQQAAPPLRQAGGGDFRLVAGPVTGGGASAHTILRQGRRAGQHRDGVQLQPRRKPGTPRHFQPMAQQAEARHVRHGMYARHGGDGGAHAVQPGHAVDHDCVIGRGQPLLLQRRAEHAHAEPLCQDQHVARLRMAVALHAVRMDGAQRHQPIDRLRTVDRVAAGDRDASRLAHRRPARQDLLHLVHADLAQRHAQQRQRQDRRAAHGVDVGQRIGGGNAPELERVIHDGREKVGGGH